MAQVVGYGHRDRLTRHREALSDAIHGAVMVPLDYPVEKLFHRFVGIRGRNTAALDLDYQVEV
jgi:hypothetical protein